MLFEMFHNEAMNYVFKKFGNHRCQGYWSIVGSFCRFVFKLLLCLLLSRLWALDQSQLMIGNVHYWCQVEGISI